MAETLLRFSEEAARHVASAQSRRKWADGACKALLEGCDSLAQVSPSLLGVGMGSQEYQSLTLVLPGPAAGLTLPDPGQALGLGCRVQGL